MYKCAHVAMPLGWNSFPKRSTKKNKKRRERAEELQNSHQPIRIINMTEVGVKSGVTEME